MSSKAAAQLPAERATAVVLGGRADRRGGRGARDREQDSRAKGGARRPSAAVGTQASAPRSTSLSLRMGQGVTRCCCFGRAAASNRSVSRCVHLDEVVELRISGSLCSDHSVVSRRQSSQQFVELALGHHLLAMLGVLNREHHDDGHCRRG